MFYREHSRVTLDCGDELITKQSHKNECDIHNILKQYQKTGIITHVQSARPTYEDLPSDLDYQTALNTQLQAEAAFAALPASVREHFSNNPGEFLAAFNDPAQESYLRENGFLKPLEAPSSSPLPSPQEPPPKPPSASAGAA